MHSFIKSICRAPSTLIKMASPKGLIASAFIRIQELSIAREIIQSTKCYIFCSSKFGIGKQQFLKLLTWIEVNGQ
jgi:hypothetical protein